MIEFVQSNFKEKIMTTPSVKKGMKTFAGCQINEEHLGLHISVVHKAAYSYLQALVHLKYLTYREQKNYVWFSLTEKGKAHLQKLEAFYARGL